MRALLVQLAVEGKLKYNQALLPGFASTTEVIDITGVNDDVYEIEMNTAPSLPPPEAIPHTISDRTDFAAVPTLGVTEIALGDALSCYVAPSPKRLPADLKRFSSICNELIPALGSAHIRHMIHHQHGTFTVLISDNGGRDGAARVVGGATSQMVAQPGADGELLIVDVLMITVMSSVARRGLGCQIFGAVERIAKQTAAARGSGGALMYTQSDQGGIASGFWARNGFVHSEEADWLTEALFAWRPAEHVHYDGITSVIACGQVIFESGFGQSLSACLHVGSPPIQMHVLFPV